MTSRGSFAAFSASSMIALITGWKWRWPNITAPEHDVLVELLGFRFHHQHRVGRAGDDEVELGLGHLVERRVEDEFVVGESDARGADRALEGRAGQRQRGG